MTTFFIPGTSYYGKYVPVEEDTTTSMYTYHESPVSQGSPVTRAGSSGSSSQAEEEEEAAPKRDVLGATAPYPPPPPPFVPLLLRSPSPVSADPCEDDDDAPIPTTDVFAADSWRLSPLLLLLLP